MTPAETRWQLIVALHFMARGMTASDALAKARPIVLAYAQAPPGEGAATDFLAAVDAACQPALVTPDRENED